MKAVCVVAVGLKEQFKRQDLHFKKYILLVC